MAGGKRKMLNRKTRNKRQNETENAEENSSAKALEESASHSSQGKKPRLEETEELEEKRPFSVQVDLTTTQPTTLINTKLKNEDALKKTSKYIPPFSRTRKSGYFEEESDCNSPVTRSSTRKRNLLHVLADVAKQKLDFEDRNYETNSLFKSERKTESCPANRNEGEQEQTRGIQLAKQPKLKEMVKTKRNFSFNPRAKRKKKIKACDPEEEELDGNTAMKETLEEKGLEEKASPETKAAEKLYEKKHHKTAEQTLKSESLKSLIKENDFKNVLDEVSVPTYYTNHDSNEAGYSKCSTDSKLASKNEIPSDSKVINAKMSSVDAVIRACVDYLIQAVEAGISVVVRDVLATSPATKKRENVDAGPAQAENHDGCAKVPCNFIKVESTNANLENSTATIRKSRQIDSDQDDHCHLEDGVGDSYRSVHAGPIDADIDEKPRMQEKAAITNSSKTNCSYAGVGGDNSSLKKLEAKSNDDNKTSVLGDTEASSNDVHHEKELKNGKPEDEKNTEPLNIDVIDDHDNTPQEKELETNVGDDSKTDCSDIDIVGDDDNDGGDTCQDKELDTNVADDSKTNHSDIDVVGDSDDEVEDLGGEMCDGTKMCYPNVVVDDDTNVKNFGGDEVPAGSKTGCPDDIVGNDDVDEQVLDNKMLDGTAVGCPANVDVNGHSEVNRKNLDVNVIDVEAHSGSKANLSDINVVQLSEVGIPLQPEYVTDVGNVDNLEHSGRNTNKHDIHMDVPAASDSNLKKGKHATVSPGSGEDGKNTGIINEVRKSASFKKSTVTNAVGFTAAHQMNLMTVISSTGSKISNEDCTSLEDVAVPSLGCVKIQPKTLEKEQNKGTNNQERRAQGQLEKQKSLTMSEKKSSAVNKECGTSGTALPKCGGEMDIDYVIDCTDSQLIAAKPSSVTDGLRYDDLNLEDLMDCTDSQLVDIDNLEIQASSNQKSAIDGSSKALVEDGTTLIQDLIKEVSSIKLYLMDVWNRYEQVKKRRHLTYTPVIKKRK